MNRELLQRVRDHIAAHPDEFYMGDWVTTTSCGTTACIAGWTVAIGRGLKPEATLDLYDEEAGCGFTFNGEAEKLLDCSYWFGHDLFHEHRWPSHYRALVSSGGEAVAAVALIDDILAGTVHVDPDEDWGSWWRSELA